MDRKRLKMNPLLWLALLATLVAVIFAPDEPQTPDAVVPPARKPPTQAVNSTPALPRAVPAVGQIGVGAPEVSEASEARADGEGRIADIFAVPRKRATREVRASVPEAPIAQSAPVAPPFDYQYMGRVVDQGDEAFFFTRAGRPYIVKAGDTLDGSFLLESVIGNAAVVVYVPLKMKQTVVLGEEK